jgi:integrase
MEFKPQTALSLKLPEGKSEHFVWDDSLPGFGVRLRNGSRRWVVQYRFHGQQRRESLGDVRKVTLDAARKIARSRFAQVELGSDPAAERRAQRQAAATKLNTLAFVAARYLDNKRGRLRPSTYKAAEQHFAVHWKRLRDRPIDSIKRADVAALLQEIIKAHGCTSAARARGNLSALFTWAMKEALCESNPVSGTNDPAQGIKPRDRVLSDDEIRIIWKACRDDDFGRIVRLLLLTGCRREEVASLLWREVNLGTGVLTIPGTRTKNHRTLELTLPAPALEILESTPQRFGRDYVFGFSGGGFSAFSYSTIALNSRIVEAEGKPLAHWTLHDCRRTVRTGLGRLGIAPHVAELVLNHVRSGVEAIYDRYRYQREIKVALATWADHVMAIVEGRASNVMPLRRA